MRAAPSAMPRGRARRRAKRRSPMARGPSSSYCGMSTASILNGSATGRSAVRRPTHRYEAGRRRVGGEPPQGPGVFVSNRSRKNLLASAQASGDPAAAPNPPKPYRPPAPTPRLRPLGILALIGALRHNPLECWAAEHFERPIVRVPLPIGHAVLVHEPAAIRHVLLDNAANYRKDALQRRVLSAGLS